MLPGPSDESLHFGPVVGVLSMIHLFLYAGHSRLELGMRSHSLKNVLNVFRMLVVLLVQRCYSSRYCSWENFNSRYSVGKLRWLGGLISGSILRSFKDNLETSSVPVECTMSTLWSFSQHPSLFGLRFRWSWSAVSQGWTLIGWWESVGTRREKCQSLTWSCWTRPWRRLESLVLDG